MSINNKTWIPDEEITHSKLNLMAADIGNVTDDIHTQYKLDHVHFKNFLCAQVNIFYYRNGVDPDLFMARTLDAGNKTGGMQFDATNMLQMMSGKIFSFKKLPSTLRYLNITYDDWKDINTYLGANVAQSYYYVYADGVSIASGSFAAVKDTWTARSIMVDLNAIADGVDIAINVYCKFDSIAADGTATGWQEANVKIRSLVAYLSAA